MPQPRCQIPLQIGIEIEIEIGIAIAIYGPPYDEDLTKNTREIGI